MPPILALFLTIGFIVFLFRRDFRERPNVTSALWIPTLWFLMIGSRTVSQWFNLFGLPVGSNSAEEGSPADATAYFVLIVTGFHVLKKRRVDLAEIMRNNKWLTVFLLYCFLAILWSDYPFVSFKRWIKILGHPIMALILFTEPDREEALSCLMKRCAYVLIPVSVLFIKYFPQLGIGFDPWSGRALATGITTNKNTLGHDCLILGFFFFWHLLKTWHREKSTARRNELFFCLFFLGMIWWLMKMSQSSTSLVSLLIGMATMLFLGLRIVNVRYIGIYVVAGIVLCVLAQLMFDVYGQVIHMVGRNPTLTDRTLIWKALLQIDINPVIGTGFESFWTGERQRKMSGLFFSELNEAHNGYLETYINLGIIGVLLMLLLIFTAFRKGCHEILANFEWGRFRLGFLAAFVFYNWTEAAFKAEHAVWFVFYIIAMDYPKPQIRIAEKSPEVTESEGNEDLIYAEDEIQKN